MSKTLVAYFSASGTTARVAKRLAQAAEADLYEIRPQIPYTVKDLDWTNKKSRSSLEMNDLSNRPALADKDAHVENYDTIFLGFPIWWYVAPVIINTFLESYDFSGKKIVVFATSGGSGLGKTIDRIRTSVTNDTVIAGGRVLNANSSVSELESWLQSVC